MWILYISNYADRKLINTKFTPGWGFTQAWGFTPMLGFVPDFSLANDLRMANRLRIGKICQFHLRVTQIEATELFFIISVILLTINYQKTVSDKLSLASYSMRKIWVIYSSVYFNYKRQFSTKIFLWVRMTISGSY